MKNYQRNTRARGKRASKKKKILLILLLVVVLLAGVLAVLELTHKTNFIADSRKKTTTDMPEGSVNYSPPTEQEKQSGNDRKEEIIKDEGQGGQTPSPTPPPTSSGKKSVKPLIVSASAGGGQIEVRGSISSIVEEGGTCTARFTKASASPVVKTSQGLENAKETICEPIIFPQSELPGTGWSVTLSYSSATAEGVSDSIPVTVQ